MTEITKPMTNNNELVRRVITAFEKRSTIVEKDIIKRKGKNIEEHILTLDGVSMAQAAIDTVLAEFSREDVQRRAEHQLSKHIKYSDNPSVLVNATIKAAVDKVSEG